MLETTIDTTPATKAARPNEFERMIVDPTVQEKAIAFPADGRSLEIALSPKTARNHIAPDEDTVRQHAQRDGFFRRHRRQRTR